jgi:hypothetical protein
VGRAGTGPGRSNNVFEEDYSEKCSAKCLEA